MRKQIGFYAIDEDHSELLQLAQDVGLLAIPEIIPTGSEVVAISPLEFQIPKDQTFFYLLPKTFASVEVLYIAIPSNPGLSKVMTLHSPVIEFFPSLTDSNKVYDGRFYLGMDNTDSLYSSVLKKLNILIRHVNKWGRTDRFGFFVGSYTAALARAGRVHLMHHQVELKIV